MHITCIKYYSSLKVQTNIGFDNIVHLTVNQRVTGSSPVEGAEKTRVTGHMICDPFCFIDRIWGLTLDQSEKLGGEFKIINFVL